MNVPIMKEPEIINRMIVCLKNIYMRKYPIIQGDERLAKSMNQWLYQTRKQFGFLVI